MNLVLKTAPSGHVVNLDRVKTHLRIESAFTDDDDYIGGLIDAVGSMLDGPNGELGRALLSQTWDMHLDCFPPSGGGIRLPAPPLITVDSVTYIDGDGVQQTLDPSLYEVTLVHGQGYIAAAYGETWPETRDKRDAVTVTFTCGYGTAADLPPDLGQAIRLILAHWYENREAVIVGTRAAATPLGADRVLERWRVRSFG